MIDWRAAMPIEIVLPITEPETEWVRGRALQKMSPARDHARLQAALIVALAPWAARRGEVGPEWRFRVEPPGEARRPLVPDVAFVSFERLEGLTLDEIQAPSLAPTVAIEILSPGDRAADVMAKVDVYLRAGTSLVVIIDGPHRTLRLYDAARGVVELHGDAVFAHEALPGFALPLRELFGALEWPPRR